MTEEEIIQRVGLWQKCDFVHPLTCGKDKCDGILVAKVNTDIDPYFDWGEPAVVLTCPKCKDYIQEHIPEVVFNINYEQFDIMSELIEEMKKRNKNG